MENIKNICNKFIITVLISLVVFYKIEVELSIYFTFTIAMWILIYLNYNFRKNLELFDRIIILSIANLSVYIFTRKFIYTNFIDKSFIWIIVYIAFLLVISIISYSFRKKDHPEKEDKELLSKRKKDLERLLDYIDRFNIVGLNGEWGTGKSFLVDKFKNEVQEEYEIIEIDILSCNLDELQLILIRELEKIMNKNKIISKYSNGLKRFLSDNKFAMTINNLIFSDKSTYSETIKGFQNELNRVGKKIIIIYEDIDRISEKDIIKKIFGISEKISNDKIKVIYQYDEESLKNIGFTEHYLEKYIPFKMNLTQLSFFEILNFIFIQEDIDEKILEIKDFEFMKPYSQQNRYNILYEEFNILEVYSIEIRDKSIRKVKNFLSELTNILHKKEYKDNKEITISFFIVKHFCPSIYEKLNIDKGLIDTLKFEIELESYTIFELINLHKSGKMSREKVKSIFEKEENRIIYSILKLFEYKNIIPENESDHEKRFKLILEEPIDKLIDKDGNAKKDRLIWSLLASGKSEFTNYEYVGNMFIGKVLEKPESEQLEAYKELNRVLYETDREEKDNQTIFLIAIPEFIELFKSFRILGANYKHQSGLINLYIKIKDVKDINVEFIQAMNYCSIETKEKYLYILNIIAKKLNITGNLNSERCFVDFLKRFIDNLAYLGYIDIGGYFNLHSIDCIGDNKNFIIEELKDINSRLVELKDKINLYIHLEELDDEINIMTSFIKKMINLICFETEAIKKKVPSIHTEVTSGFVNQKEFDRLKRLGNISKETKQELNSSYLQGKMTAYEIDKLIDELNK